MQTMQLKVQNCPVQIESFPLCYLSFSGDSKDVLPFTEVPEGGLLRSDFCDSARQCLEGVKFRQTIIVLVAT